MGMGDGGWGIGTVDDVDGENHQKFMCALGGTKESAGSEGVKGVTQK